MSKSGDAILALFKTQGNYITQEQYNELYDPYEYPNHLYGIDKK